jgi:hypothetical protein
VSRKLAQDYDSFCQHTDGDGNTLFSKYQLKVIKGKQILPSRYTSEKDEGDTEDCDGSESPAPEKKKKRLKRMIRMLYL